MDGGGAGWTQREIARKGMSMIMAQFSPDAEEMQGGHERPTPMAAERPQHTADHGAPNVGGGKSGHKIRWCCNFHTYMAASSTHPRDRALLHEQRERSACALNRTQRACTKHQC